MSRPTTATSASGGCDELAPQQPASGTGSTSGGHGSAGTGGGAATGTGASARTVPSKVATTR